MKYFLHDTSAFDDEKITELYLQFGYEGLGLFYTCLEKIGKQEKPVKTQVLKAQLRVGKRLEKCWSFMEQIGLISSNNGETFNKQLLNFSEKYQIKKEKTREKVSEWRKKQQDMENVTGYVPVSNPPKVKERKVKESKVNPKPGKPDYAYIDSIVKLFCSVHGSYEVVSWGKERSAAGKLLKIYKEKYPESSSEETLAALEDYFRRCVNISDSWLKQNMSIPIIIDKFNPINTILKNGNNKGSGVTDTELANILAKKIGIHQ